MPTVLYTGHLSFPTKLLINCSNMVAWISGNARNTVAMKNRVKSGYEGICSDDVTRYDELGMQHYTKIASELLKEIDVKNKEVLDVGCGTGILSMAALESGAKKVVCGDLSEYMLEQCRKKALKADYSKDKIDFRQMDAETLPYENNSFDLVISQMVLAFVPNQNKVISEMTRVLRPGGSIAVATQGPEHLREAIEAFIQASSARYFFGYRIEFWPRKEIELKKMLSKATLIEISTHRETSYDEFETGTKVYDFYAATSGSWWSAKYPADKVEIESTKTRNYFERKKVTKVTEDIVFAYGRKP